MSCPVCGDRCRCVQPQAHKLTITLDDVDPYDDSEEQFASSVAGQVYDPRVYHSKDLKSRDRKPTLGRTNDSYMIEPSANDPVDPSLPQAEQEFASGSLKAASERYASLQASPAEPPVAPSEANPENWHDELNSRLQNYKARRRRTMGDESLSFNFESTIGNHVFLRPERELDPEPVAAEPCTPYMQSATAPALEPPAPEETLPQAPAAQSSFFETQPPEEKPAPLPETAKLILFPRPPMMVEAARDELAETVFDKPRILDAPESFEAVAVPLSDITLQPSVPEDQCAPHAEPELELPYKVAPMMQRVVAELVDLLLVLVASATFGVIVAKLNNAFLLQDTRSLAETVLAVPAILWSLYKYIFLVYGGRTLGMQITRLRLVDFNGAQPRQRSRQFRALAMLVSIFPLGLGLIWSFVDVDTLCWHDRISHTYMTAP